MGLLPYREQHARYFFGRTTERRLIRDNLRASRLTILYGASGVGKSSVLGAGVAHDLRSDPDYLVVYFGTPGVWINDPVEGLNTALRNALQGLPGFKPDGNNDQQPGLFRGLTTQFASVDRTLLLILDQFEEYFQYHPDEKGAYTFAEEFPRLLRQDEFPMHCLLSMREDMLATLDRFKKRIPTLLNNRLRIDFLSREDAIEAVLMPLEVFNKEAHAQGPMKMEHDVAERLVEKIIGVQKSERQRVQTPYLQLVLERWWNREVETGSHEMLEKTLQEIGGVETIVDKHLELTLSQLGPAAEDIASSVFQFMVTPGGRKIAQTGSELAGNVASLFSEAEVTGLLEKLHNARVLTTLPPPLGSAQGERCYEFAHDVMARAALDWRRHYKEQKALAEAERKRLAERERQKQELQAAQAEADKQRELAEQQRELARRIRQWAIGFALVAGIAVVVLVWGYRQSIRRNRAEKQENSYRLAAIAVDQLGSAPDLSLLLAMQAVKAEPTREAIDALNRSQSTLREEKVLRGHSDKVIKVVFSPDGGLIASASQDHTARIWSAKTGQLLQTLSAGEHEVYSVSFNHDGTQLVTESGQVLQLWDVKSGHPLDSIPIAGWLVAAIVHPKEQVIATAELDAPNYTDSTVRIWKIENGKVNRKVKHWQVPGVVKDLAFSISGSALATASSDHVVRVWQVNTQKEFLTLRGHTDQVMGVAFSPDGQHLASAGMDRTIRVWNAKGESLQTVLTGHSNTVFMVSYDPSGKRLVSASADGRVKIWDAQTGRQLLNFSGHTGPVEGVAFSPDGKRVASASWDGTIRVWVADTLGDGVTGVAFNPDGTQLLVGSRDKTVELWDGITGHELAPLPYDFPGEVRSVAFSRDGKFLAASSDCDAKSSDPKSGCKHAVLVWYAQTRASFLSLPNAFSVNAIAFRPNVPEVVTGDDEGRVVIWPLKLGAMPRVLSETETQVNSVAFSPDGTLVAAANSDLKEPAVKLWKSNTGELAHTLKGHKMMVMGVAFSPDGTAVATASLDGTIKLWDVASEKLVQTIPIGTNAVTCVAFSPDNKYLAAGSWDMTVRIFQLKTGREQPREIEAFTVGSSVNGVEFSPNGKWLAVASENSSPELYTLDVDILKKAAEEKILKLGRTLQPDECQKYLHLSACPTTP